MPSFDTSSDLHDHDDIIKSNAAMLEKQYACDVYFRLGKDGSVYGAHRYMLISRSSVFDAMFCGTLQSNEESSNEVLVPDIEPEAFKSFLRYVYCRDTDITADNVIVLLYAAKKYAITGLVNKCIGFVENCLDVENACVVMEQAHFFDELEFRQKVLTTILRRAGEVLETDDVTELCEECLATIVGSDMLTASEDQVLSACTRWAQSECSRRGLSVSDENCRIMLGKTLYLIRFPLLEPSVFVNRVANSQLLTEEEKVDVMGRYIVASRPSTYFSTELRSKQKLIRFNRYQSRHEAAFNNRSGSNAISFMINRAVYVEGFIIFGTCRSGEQELKVSGRIVDQEDKTLCSADTSVVTVGNPDSCLYDIMFEESIRLHADTLYTLIADIQGAHTFGGQGGRLTAFTNDTIITFSNSEKCQTGTCVNTGQLPGLIFSL